MNKMVINHLEKLFVTKDTGTVIKELEVEHPAAKMMVMATQMMEQEVRGSSYARLCHTFINPTPSLPPLSPFSLSSSPVRWEMVPTLSWYCRGLSYPTQRNSSRWDSPLQRLPRDTSWHARRLSPFCQVRGVVHCKDG